jgi:hypothetical protein
MGWRYTWFVISFFFFYGIGYTLYVQSKEVLEVRLTLPCDFSYHFEDIEAIGMN